MKTRLDALNDLFLTLTRSQKTAEEKEQHVEVGMIFRHVDGERILVQYESGEEFVLDVMRWTAPSERPGTEFLDEPMGIEPPIDVS